MEVDKQLRRKITSRWKILAGAQGDAQEAAAYAQLEYILMEAGLLARSRKKRKNREREMDEVGPDEKYEAPRYDKEDKTSAIF